VIRTAIGKAPRAVAALLVWVASPALLGGFQAAVLAVPAVLWAVPAVLWAVPAGAEPAPRYELRAVHDPDGIGKFYMGREIADAMGPGGLPWLERPDREAEEQPSRVVEALRLRPGDTVADLGAGSGYFTFRLAQAVGDRGRVYAVDLQPEMLAAIRSRALREHVAHVKPIAATETDPKLPANRLDLVLMVDVYHELAYPYEVMSKVRDALKPGGRIALVEYRKEDPAVGIKEVHKMSEAQILRELTAAGYTLVETVRTLSRQHLMIFRK
jgi:ubiquinone/menaquinone biosynthesis C-methylase UbiE